MRTENLEERAEEVKCVECGKIQAVQEMFCIDSVYVCRGVCLSQYLDSRPDK